jgi:hypothetical protein
MPSTHFFSPILVLAELATFVHTKPEKGGNAVLWQGVLVDGWILSSNKSRQWRSGCG